MKFLIDAHMPPRLCTILQTAGHDAVHTSALPAQNRTADRDINAISMEQQRVVISKDTDFYYSHLLNQHPHKLLLVCTGNIRARELLALFQRQLPAIIAALESNSLVELYQSNLKVVV